MYFAVHHVSAAFCALLHVSTSSVPREAVEAAAREMGHVSLDASVKGQVKFGYAVVGSLVPLHIGGISSRSCAKSQ